MRRAKRGIGGGGYKSGLLGLLVLGAIGCKSPAEKPPQERVPPEPSATRGRFFPNLVVTYDPGNGVNELWVKLEVPLDGMGKEGTEKALALLKEGSKESLKELRDSMLSVMKRPYDPNKPDKKPRKAFRQIVRCAFDDNIAEATTPGSQPVCSTDSL